MCKEAAYKMLLAGPWPQRNSCKDSQVFTAVEKPSTERGTETNLLGHSRCSLGIELRPTEKKQRKGSKWRISRKAELGLGR